MAYKPNTNRPTSTATTSAMNKRVKLNPLRTRGSKTYQAAAPIRRCPGDKRFVSEAEISI